MKLHNLLATAFAATLCTSVAFAEVPAKPTFTKDIQPILQENCQTCHRDKRIKIGGLVAPFSLISYDQVRPWAKAVGKAVSAKDMPPWDAAEYQHGTFRNERSLTQDEIDTIVRWVDQGAKRGTPKDAPQPRIIEDREWWIGEPDLIVELPEKVWVGDEVEDWQPTIPVELTEEQLPEDRWMRAVEAQGDADFVHHIVVYSVNPHQKRRTEAAGALGYGNIGGLAPGAEPSLMQDGYGILMKKGSRLNISMHYHKEPGENTGDYDQSRLGFFFYPKDAEVRPVNVEPIGNLRFAIPPHAKSHPVTKSHTFKEDFEILNMLPHMHFRGASAKYTAFYPDGSEEVLLDVPNYDYAWQTSYEY
ncbi:MAG: hypothetical protein VCC01_05775, partial [Candidatus Hydrogenedentota bacterium]